jgi:hypothetical protein
VRYRVNENYFENLNPNSAYSLGLWWADGCIYHKNSKYIFDLSQNIQDKYIIEDIQKDMLSSHKLYIQKETVVRLQIQSKKIYNSLIEIGGKPNKSKIIRMPNIDRKLYPYFVLGYFDGDGTIYLDKSRNRYRSSFSSGSEKMLKDLHFVLKKDIKDLKGSIRKREKKNTKWFELNFSFNDTKRLKDYFYKNNELYLKRKKEIFDLV